VVEITGACWAGKFVPGERMVMVPHTEMLILGWDSIQERQTTLLGSEIHIDARWELSGKMVDVSAP
jgi:hypothetical protein